MKRLAVARCAFFPESCFGAIYNASHTVNFFNTNKSHVPAA
jgi:hypothetical protein